MSNKPLNMTRNQLAEFLPNQRAVRAFEQLLKQVNELLPNDVATIMRMIEESYIEGANASARAQEAADSVERLSHDTGGNLAVIEAKANELIGRLNDIAVALAMLSVAPPEMNDNSLSADYIDLRDNGWLPAYRLGRIWFGPTGTLEVAMGNGNITQQVGEEFFCYGKASSAISDTNLQLVYKTGTVGASGVITFAPVVAGITDPDQILGVATEPIANNGFGRITTMGGVHGINTTGSVYGETWADNDDIWYNPVTGGLTKVKPSAPNVKVQVGTVINAGSGGSGSFSVKIGSSSSLGGTDSNVQFSSLASGNIIIYDAVAQYFKNAFLTAGTNVTITNGPGSITISVSGAPPTGTAGGVLSGTYPNPGFAVDMATQSELDTAIATREPTITAGTTAQYWRGDKSWRDFATDVRASVLTGLSTATNAVITAADTVLSALGKLQKQISDNLTTLTNHTSNTSNPHSVTKTQVGLGNVTNDAQLKIASNLSDLASAATARSNLGLGSAATMTGPSGSIVGTTDTQYLTNKTYNVINAATYNDNSAHAIAGFNNTWGTIIIESSAGKTFLPYYANGGSGIAFAFSLFDPDAGTFSYGAGPTVSFTQAGTGGNTFSVSIIGGSGTMSIQRTAGSLSYTVKQQILGF